VDDHLNEFSYDAELAGLGYSFNRDGDGLFLAAYGFNDKLHVLLTKLVHGMRNHVVNQERFDVIKESLVRGLQNWKLNAPYDHAMHYTRYLLTSIQWTNEEKEEALKGVSNVFVVTDIVQELQHEMFRLSFPSYCPTCITNHWFTATPRKKTLSN
jgi:insulysin